MQILVINPGSSSIKFSVFRGDAAEAVRSLAEGELSGIGGSAELKFGDAQGRDLASGVQAQAATMHEALTSVERALDAAGFRDAEAVGYRVVHPGPKLKGHQRITPEVMAALKGAEEFAPLHDPVAIELIEEMMRRMPQVCHVACFDTVFHETMPEVATRYALPAELFAEGVRRYGFHGLSCESVMGEMRDALGDRMPARVVIAHLGSGASVTACVDGKSVDTTMGLTPTGGVVMGTRPGDLDPGLVLYLLRRPGASLESVEHMLNHDSGLKALGGVNDMRELRKRARAGEAKAALAIELFVTSVARAIAGMLVPHGGDAVVFTGGIGEHDSETRAEVVSRLATLRVAVDESANAAGLGGERVRAVHAPESRVSVFCAAADEDRMIAGHVAAMCSTSQQDLRASR